MADITSSSLKNFLTDIAQPTQVREEVKPLPTPPPPPQDKPADTPPVNEPPPPTIDKKLIEASADVVIAFADTAQKNIFKFLGNRKRETETNRITESNAGLLKLKKAITTYQKNESNGGEINQLTEQDVQLLNIHQKTEDFIKDLPFTDKEKNNIAQPLMYIIEKNGGIIPPEICLMMAFASAIGSRVGEMYTF